MALQRIVQRNQLVDPNDVIEAANLAAFPATGVAERIYIALDTSAAYFWNGAYSLIGKIKTSQLDNDGADGINAYITLLDLPSNTSYLVNDGDTGTSTYVETNELGATAFSNDYNDLTNLPPGDKAIENRYANVAALYAGQSFQSDKAIQYVNDASGDPTVGSGYAYYEYLGTTVGDITDYRKLSEEESMELALGIAKHTQSTPDTLWIFNHNLNEMYPTVTVYDEANKVVIPLEIEAIDITTIHITFPTVETGNAVAVLGNTSSDITNALKVFEQETPSQSWLFTHNLKSLTPLVTVYGDDNKVIIPADIEAIDANNILVTFSALTTGSISITGGLSEGMTFDSVGYEHLADNLIGREDMTNNVIDWLTGSTKLRTMVANSTFTDINLPQGTDTRVLELHIDGNFSVTLPAYWTLKGGYYEGTVSNMFVVTCVNGNPGSERVYYIIKPDIV
jgi:hypothetical protein